MQRLFVVGDSISMHYGPYLAQMVSGRFEYDRKGGKEAALKDQFGATDQANGGDSSAVLAYLRMRRAHRPIEADVILINCGLHDIRRGLPELAHQVPIDQYRANLRAIIDEVRSMGAKMVWVRSTPVDDQQHNTRSQAFHRYAGDLDAYNAAADAIMAEAGVPSIDLYAFTKSLGTDVFCDHVHFRDPVRQLQAAYIAGWLSGAMCDAA